MQGAMKSAGVGLLAEAVVFAGPAKPREALARNFYDKKIDVTATHVVEQGCELLGGAVGEVLTPARVSLPMNGSDEHWADRVVGNEKFCLISPGGGWGAKLWPPERFGQVAAELGRAGVRSVVNASGNGSPEADAVAAASQGFARAVPCSVGQLIALVRRAAVVIGGDTGPLHLAAALERPVVADLWADRSGAEWALRHAFAGLAGCGQPDQPQAVEDELRRGCCGSRRARWSPRPWKCSVEAPQMRRSSSRCEADRRA